MKSYVNAKENNKEEIISQLIGFINDSFAFEEKDSLQIENYKKLIKFVNNNQIILNETDAKLLLEKCPVLDTMIKSVVGNNIYVVAPLKELEKVVSDYDYDFDNTDETEQLEETANNSKIFTGRVKVKTSYGTGQYLNDIGKQEMLTREEEVALFKRLEAGDESAREEIINHNLKLVVSIAKKYTYSGMDLDDLIQEGNEGLMKAIGEFDYKKGNKFSTYATHWIKQKVRRSICDKRDAIRIPVHMFDFMANIKRINNRYIREYGREATNEELATETMSSLDKIIFAKSKMSGVVSLSTPVGEEEDSTLDMFIVDEDNDVEETTLNSMFVLEFMEFFNSTNVLTEREKQVLYYRFGKQITLEEVGKIYNVTRERIRQIEHSALRKIRKTPFISQARNENALSLRR